MKALVTGATGFLGSHLVDLLLREGHTVVCLVRRSSNLRWLENKPVQLVYGELKVQDPAFEKGLEGIDWFFHVAGLLTTTRPNEYAQVNAEATRTCLEACLDKAPQIKRFVLVSSLAVTGPGKIGTLITETTPLNPITEYGESKRLGEQIALTYRDRIPLTVIRPPAIYGARDVALLPVFAAASKGFYFLPGFQERQVSLAYVEDVAGACLWGATANEACGEIYFVTDGGVYPWQAVGIALQKIMHHKVWQIPIPKLLLQTVALLEEQRAKLLHCAPKINRGHVRQFYVPSWGISGDKIRQAGFEPKFDLMTGMQKAVEGYRHLGWI